ncbi:MAG TPA: AAA family ATPase [Steroidobacteraceae bacterium]|nr:AAA family ATPase [Steroidobacteraceae bacterium]
MQTPSAYAALHHVHTPIRLIETHVSWVFLTGRYAYKIKKPVRLSFLDYSTIARRAALCHEELRLNRRYAPELYVDVVPIGGTPSAPRVGAHEDVFEHALRMLQFDPSLELGELLQHGVVDTGEFVKFGAELATMHASAERAPPGAEHGHPERTHRVTLANFDELGRVFADGARRDGTPSSGERAHAQLLARLDATHSHVEAMFRDVRPLMERRWRAGNVRECHGDLHCGNVVRWQGRLVAFDGLEFDPALRFIDVASDLAFLTMDLSVHGRTDLRTALLDAWTTTGGDYEAVELLPYYEPYRALVRAKVAALRGEHAASAADAARHDAQRYLDQATTASTRATPALVVMIGLSGSGKTWLARRLAVAGDALHLRSDVERKRLAGLGPLDDSRSPADGGLYTSEFGERTYARLRECVRSCLRGRQNVIVDAANLRRHERAAFAALAREQQARVRFVHCVAPLTTLKERIATRRAGANDASEATVELLDRQPGYWEPLTPEETAHTFVVDTTDTQGIERAIADIVQHCRATRG